MTSEHISNIFNNRAKYDIYRVFMIAEKKVENVVIVTNLRSKGDSVLVDLRFTEPTAEEPTRERLERIIEPLPNSPMEKAGREVAKGYIDVMQKQLQQQMRQLQPFLPATPPPDIIRITLTKEEYVELGRPTVFDKLILTLRLKTES